jgi:cytidylate kinase
MNQSVLQIEQPLEGVEQAVRRAREVGGDLAQVLAQLRERDARDMGRADAPLRPAQDALLIDTTDLTIEQAVALASAAVLARFPERTNP